MESLITTFHIDWKIITAQVINFAIVFLVLYLFALKPLKKLMAEREEKIKKGVSDAQDNAILISKTKKEYSDIIDKAKSEAHELFQKGKKEAEARKTEMLEKAKEEVSVIISSGKKVLEDEKIRIVEEAKKDIVSLAMRATEKILQDKNDIKTI